MINPIAAHANPLVALVPVWAALAWAAPIPIVSCVSPDLPHCGGVFFWLAVHD